MKYGFSKIKIPREVLVANCLEQTRGTSAKSVDQLLPPIAWNRHEQLLVIKQFITSSPIAWNRHE
ncbi:15028_t:CDS:1, partial [Acaulospora colombiana]